MSVLSGPETIPLEGKKGKKVKGEKAPKSSAPKAPAALPMVRINLLPGDIAEKQALRAAVIKSGIIVLAVLGVLILLWVGLLGRLIVAQNSLTTERNTGAALQTKVAGFGDVTTTYDTLAARQAQLALALGREVTFSDYLTTLSRTIPADTSLQSISLSNDVATGGALSTTQGLIPTGIGKVSVSGKTRGYAGLVTWLQFLSQAKNFTGDYLTSATQQKGAVLFATSASLTKCALTNHYSVQPDPRTLVLRGATSAPVQATLPGCGVSK